MVTQKYAIKSHLTSLLSSRSHHTILISVYCKNCENTITLFLWLDTKSPCLQAAHITCGTSKVTMAIAHALLYKLHIALLEAVMGI